MEKIYKFILKISDRNGAIYQHYRDGLNITSYLPWCDLKQIDISFLTEAANNVFNFISHHCTSLYGQLWQQLSNSYSFCLLSLHYRSLVYMWRGCSYSVHKAFIRHTVQHRGKTQNPRYHQGQNQQFADGRSDSTRTMIVDKFYHFHHHRGITLIAGDRGSVAHNEQMYFINLLVQSISVV